MTKQAQGQSRASAGERVLIRVQDDAYAVPVAVLEQGRVQEEQELARVRALLAGAGEEAGADVHAYLLPAQTLAQYRVPGTGAAVADRSAAGDEDTRGFMPQPAPLVADPNVGGATAAAVGDPVLLLLVTSTLPEVRARGWYLSRRWR